VPNETFAAQPDFASSKDCARIRRRVGIISPWFFRKCTGWRMRPYVKFSLPLGKGSKTSLTLSNETFINLNSTAFQRQDGLDRMRSLIAINTPLTKAVSLEVGYLNQHGFVRGGEDTDDHVASFSLSLSL